jgi:hypothetical protein
VLALSPSIKTLLGLPRTITFAGDSYVLFGPATIVATHHFGYDAKM